MVMEVYFPIFRKARPFFFSFAFFFLDYLLGGCSKFDQDFTAGSHSRFISNNQTRLAEKPLNIMYIVVNFSHIQITVCLCALDHTVLP